MTNLTEFSKENHFSQPMIIKCHANVQPCDVYLLAKRLFSHEMNDSINESINNDIEKQHYLLHSETHKFISKLSALPREFGSEIIKLLSTKTMGNTYDPVSMDLVNMLFDFMDNFEGEAKHEYFYQIFTLCSPDDFFNIIAHLKSIFKNTKLNFEVASPLILSIINSLLLLSKEERAARIQQICKKFPCCLKLEFLNDILAIDVVKWDDFWKVIISLNRFFYDYKSNQKNAMDLLKALPQKDLENCSKFIDLINSVYSDFLDPSEINELESLNYFYEFTYKSKQNQNELLSIMSRIFRCYQLNRNLKEKEKIKSDKIKIFTEIEKIARLTSSEKEKFLCAITNALNAFCGYEIEFINLLIKLPVLWDNYTALEQIKNSKLKIFFCNFLNELPAKDINCWFAFFFPLFFNSECNNIPTFISQMRGLFNAYMLLPERERTDKMFYNLNSLGTTLIFLYKYLEGIELHRRSATIERLVDRYPYFVQFLKDSDAKRCWYFLIECRFARIFLACSSEYSQDLFVAMKPVSKEEEINVALAKELIIAYIPPENRVMARELLNEKNLSTHDHINHFNKLMQHIPREKRNILIIHECANEYAVIHSSINAEWKNDFIALVTLVPSEELPSFANGLLSLSDLFKNEPKLHQAFLLYCRQALSSDSFPLFKKFLYSVLWTFFPKGKNDNLNINDNFIELIKNCPPQIWAEFVELLGALKNDEKINATANDFISLLSKLDGISGKPSLLYPALMKVKITFNEGQLQHLGEMLQSLLMHMEIPCDMLIKSIRFSSDVNKNQQQHNSPYVQKQGFFWLMAVLIALIQRNVPTCNMTKYFGAVLLECYKLHNPILRAQLSDMALDVLMDNTGREHFIELIQSNPSTSARLSLLLLAKLIARGMALKDAKLLAKGLKSLGSKSLKRQEVYVPLYNLLLFCCQAKTLKNQDFEVIWRLTGLTELSQSELGQGQQQQKLAAQARKKFKNNDGIELALPSSQCEAKKNFLANIVQRLTILNCLSVFDETSLKAWNLLIHEKDLESCFFNKFIKIIPIKTKENLPQRFKETFLASRMPNALMTYASSLMNLTSSFEAISALGRFIDGVLQGDIAKIRRENNPHLDRIFELRPDLKALWSEKITIHNNDPLLQTEITDDPFDLFLCGTEVPDSCLRVNGDSFYNRGLLGNILDGKNRLILQRNQYGKIAYRALLRLYLDEKGQEPELFYARIYPKKAPDIHREAIHNCALQEALRLWLPLANGQVSESPISLISLRGSSPFNYIDEINENEGLIEEGLIENVDYRIQARRIAPKPIRIVAHYDTGYGNYLTIRGDGAGLSWDQGLVMRNLSKDTWVWHTLSHEFTYKILFNDKIYEIGENHRLKNIEKIFNSFQAEVYPSFS